MYTKNEGTPATGVPQSKTNLFLEPSVHHFGRRLARNGRAVGVRSWISDIQKRPIGDLQIPLSWLVAIANKAAQEEIEDGEVGA